MGNRTILFKAWIKELESLITDGHIDSDTSSFSTAKTVLEAGKSFVESMRDVKMQMKNQLAEQQKKYSDLFGGKKLPDEKIKEDLGVNRFEIEKIINEKTEENFDNIIDFCKELTQYQHKRFPFLSENRKQAKLTLKNLIKQKELFGEYLDALSKTLNSVRSEIKIQQINKGDISNLAEISNVPILLSGGEKCYIKVDNVDLYEDRAVRDTVGSYDGFSFRVAKGVSYRMGGFNARGESHMEKRLIDKGIFYVTSKRYIFDGSTKNIEGELRKVISVEAYSDGIKISRANKRDEVFAGDLDGEYIGAVISGLVKNIK